MPPKPRSSTPNPLLDRIPFFYGWVVWAVATLGMIASAPGQSFSVSLFFDHFITDLGLTRTTVSSLYSLGTVLAAASLTFIGRAIDRYGNRRMGALISLVFAAVLGLFALVSGPLTLLLGFLMIRMLGQGSMTLNSTAVIPQWFRKRRGLAMGAASFLFVLSQGPIAQGVTRLIDAIGWRSAWLVLGGIIAAVVLPATLLLMRDRPEDVGLRPDGDPAPTHPGQPEAETEVSYTLIEAARTPILWVFIMTQVLNAGWVTGLIIHQISLFEVVGHPEMVAVNTFSLAATVAAGVTLVAGPLTNRVRPGLVAALQMLLLGGTLILAMLMTTPALTVAYALALGGLFGIWPVFSGVVYANLYGRAHYGSIRGLVQTAGVLGSAIGPVIFSLAFDAAGDYRLALLGGVALAALTLVASLLVKPPTRPQTPAQ